MCRELPFCAFAAIRAALRYVVRGVLGDRGVPGRPSSREQTSICIGLTNMVKDAGAGRRGAVPARQAISGSGRPSPTATWRTPWRWWNCRCASTGRHPARVRPAVARRPGLRVRDRPAGGRPADTSPTSTARCSPTCGMSWSCRGRSVSRGHRWWHRPAGRRDGGGRRPARAAWGPAGGGQAVLLAARQQGLLQGSAVAQVAQPVAASRSPARCRHRFDIHRFDVRSWPHAGTGDTRLPRRRPAPRL